MEAQQHESILASIPGGPVEFLGVGEVLGWRHGRARHPSILGYVVIDFLVLVSGLAGGLRCPSATQAKRPERR